MCPVQKKHFLFIVLKAKRINETCLSAERSREEDGKKEKGGGVKSRHIVVFQTFFFVNLDSSLC